MITKKKRILNIYTGGTIGMMKTRDGYAPQKEKFHQLLEAIPEPLADRKPNHTESAYTGDYLRYEIVL